jgi:hypothetical protein
MRTVAKKVISLVLAVMLIVLCSFPASAVQTSKEMASALQSKYGMKISFVSNYTENEKLALLTQTDSVLSHVGTAFVKEVVSVYTKNGYSAALNFEQVGWSDQLGLFGVSKKNATIRIKTFKGLDGSSEELDSFALAHEFAHMINYAFDIKKGASYVKKKWDACGTGAYISDYASTSYREDFAETFAAIATSDSSQAELLMAMESDSTGVLKKKVNCLDALLGEFNNFSTILKMYDFQGIGAACNNTRVSVNSRITQVYLYNIKGNNYFKLRDLAMLLNGTDKQFEVSWDAENKAIALISGAAYTAVGGELAYPATVTDKASPTTAKVYIDNSEVTPTAYNIKGNNYFKLRDIAKALDFFVDWDMATLIIDTSAGYVDE